MIKKSQQRVQRTPNSAKTNLYVGLRQKDSYFKDIDSGFNQEGSGFSQKDSRFSQSEIHD